MPSPTFLTLKYGERERLSQEMSQHKLEPKSKLTNLIHFKEAEFQQDVK